MHFGDLARSTTEWRVRSLTLIPYGKPHENFRKEREAMLYRHWTLLMPSKHSLLFSHSTTSQSLSSIEKEKKKERTRRLASEANVAVVLGLVGENDGKNGESLVDTIEKESCGVLRG